MKKVDSYVLLIIVLLSLSCVCKYEEKPSYSFIADPEANYTNWQPYRSYLSPDKKLLMKVSKNKNQNQYMQRVYDFNGSKICSVLLDNMTIAGWPNKTNGIYYYQYI